MLSINYFPWENFGINDVKKWKTNDENKCRDIGILIVIIHGNISRSIN